MADWMQGVATEKAPEEENWLSGVATPKDPKDAAVAELQNLAKTDARGVGNAIASGINRGVIDTLDLPFNLINMAVDTVNSLTGAKIPRTATPTQVGDLITNALTGLSPFETLRDPALKGDSGAEQIVSRIAEFASGGTALAKGAKGTAEALVSSRAQRGVQASPVQDTATRLAGAQGLVGREAVAGAGAGAGFGVAEQFTENPLALMGASVLGGVTPALATAPLKSAANQASRVVSSFTEEGGRARVGQVLVDNATDAGQAIESLRTNRLLLNSVVPNAKGVPTSILTEDAGVQRSINAAVKNDNNLIRILEEGEKSLEGAVALSFRELAAGGSPSEVVPKISKFVNDRVSKVKDEIRLAQDLLTKLEVQATGEGRPPSEISQDYVNALESSFNRAKKQEKALWELVDQTQPLTNVSTLKGAVTQLQVKLTKEMQAAANFPNKMFKLVRRLDEDSTFVAVQNVRSAILEETRAANKAGKSGRARVLNQLDEKVFDFMATSAASPSHRAAAEFTKTLHTSYNRGKLGKLLNIDSQGSLVIDPEVALSKIVRTGDNIGDVKRSIELENNQALNAGGEFPAATGLTGNITEALWSKFGQAGTAAKRATFFKQYRQTLDLFPELSRSLDNIDKEITRVTDDIASREDVAASLTDKKRTSVAALLGAEPDNVFAALRGVGNTDLKNITAVASTENVLTGLQSVYVRQFMNKLVGTSETLDGVLSKNVDLRRGFELVLSNNQRTQLRRLQKANGLLTSQSDRAAASNVADVFDSSGLTQILARIVGIRVAGVVAPSGPGALAAAAIFSRQAQKIANMLPSSHAARILEEALLDPKALEDLMKLGLKNQITPNEANAVLRTYYLRAGVTVPEDEGDEQ